MSEPTKKQANQVMLSAIQPTSIPHLGNYLGAMKRWVQSYQSFRKSYFFVVDLHALTVPRDPAELRQRTYEVIAYYIACGLNPDKAILFCQSHVPEHSQLAWVLNCFTYMGELNRMTQFKDKSKNSGKNVGAGLFTYPILMASDILLYHPDYIPVGNDQKQHVELARDLAIRINNRFEKELFTVPEPMIGTAAARVMDLQDPTMKMSKSTPHPKGLLLLSDSSKEIKKKINTAVTDSGSEITYSEEKPGIKNLLEIQSSLTKKNISDIVSEYSGKMYGHLKKDTGAMIWEELEPIQKEANKLLSDFVYLDQILAKGAEKARDQASSTLKTIHETIGLVSSSR